MLIKNSVRLLRKPLVAQFNPPKRNWAQVGTIIAVPPRNKCSFGEFLLHAGFMLTVWLAPVAYFASQIKVWRREYIGK